MFEIVYRYDPEHPQAVSPPRDAAEARRRLEDGNRDFAHVFDGVMQSRKGALRRIVPFDPRDLGVSNGGGEPLKQQPFAVVLGCSDARVPTELVFNQWCNELFVVRVAGNVLGSEVLGSIDYAVTQLGNSVKLLVVLAHSGCGAVTAAVDVFLKPAGYLEFAGSHPLRTIIDRIVVVTRGADRALNRVHGGGVTARPGYRRALIETTVALNGALTAFTLKRELRHRQNSPEGIAVFYGVYDLGSRCVHLPGIGERCGGGPVTRLSEPPAGVEAFDALARTLAASERIAHVLAEP
ncbi:MAG: hypothetical protein MUE49_11185 [Rhodospirillales bacterium]|jgi:carbonic anhydrase|nr:hypothetical protein [Rhodospirillales bacterium]